MDSQQTAIQLGNKLAATLADGDIERDKSFAEIRNSISMLLSKMATISKTTSAENNILKRLYFPSIYARADAIADVDFGTFDWLLEEETDVSTSSSSSLDANESDNIDDVDSGTFDELLEEETNVSATSSSSFDANEGDDRSGNQSSIESGTISNDGTKSPTRSRERSWEEQEEDSENEKRRRTRELFLAWLETGNEIFHISGKAGGGKSTLMKFLSQHPNLQDRLKHWAGAKKLIFATFFFWSSGEKEQKSMEGLYRSLLFETLKQCPELISEVFPEQCANGDLDLHNWAGTRTPLRVPELKDAISKIVTNHSFPNHRFCFFIDGLDEFEADLKTDHWQLAQDLQRWAVSKDIKICVSSRPHEEFLQGFNPDLRMHLHELTRSDVRRFIYGKLNQEPNYVQISDDLNEDRFNTKHTDNLSKIILDVIYRADGVFLWVRLVARSLVEGVRRRDSVKVLRQKIEKLPKGLEPLFDQMLSCKDSSDQERLDKILLLAERLYSPDGYPHCMNVLLFSWLDDLEDPDFPFSAPIQAYTDAEIRHRQKNVRSQLIGLSKGLLEVRRSLRERCEDVYYEEKVGFCHRTVQDYLNDPKRLAVIQQRLGQQFSAGDALQKLRLAEFKFAKNTGKCVSRGPVEQLLNLQSLVWRNDLCTSRHLEECGKIIEHHRQTSNSHLAEKGERFGTIYWIARGEPPIPGETKVKSLSYLHYLSFHGYFEYVEKQVRADLNLLKFSEDLSLLLTASLAQSDRRASNSDFVHALLQAGSSPNDRVTVNFADKKCSSRHEQHCRCKRQSATVWMIFLSTLARSLTGRLTGRLTEGRMGRGLETDFEVLEIFLKAGADCNAYFLIDEKGDTHHSGYFLLKEKLGAENITAFTVGDFILLCRPPNMDSLMQHILKQKGTWLWQGTRQIITSTLSTLKLQEAQKSEQNYPRLPLESLESAREKYFVKAVCVNGDRLESGFDVRLC